MSGSQAAEATGKALQGWTVVITRPVGTATRWQQRFSAAGASPLLLPGMAIRDVPLSTQASAQWRAAAMDAAWIFTSPVAVSRAHAQFQRWPPVLLMAVGQATAERMRQHGAPHVVAPLERQDSEGVLALPALQQMAGSGVTVVTGEGGRGLLQSALIQRGARVRVIEVYRRVPARLDRRHVEKVQALPARSILLLSSAEALVHLQSSLPTPSWRRLQQCAVIVSSPRLRQQVVAAGFPVVACAGSALLSDMLAAAEEFAREKGRL
ncbi:uroporphyrinogen-III synthase [Frateuria aurantia]